jgi:archaellum component FlaC
MEVKMIDPSVLKNVANSINNSDLNQNLTKFIEGAENTLNKVKEKAESLVEPIEHMAHQFTDFYKKVEHFMASLDEQFTESSQPRPTEGLQQRPQNQLD